VVAAKSVVEALREALDSVNAALVPIDAEIAHIEAERAASKQRREAIQRAVALSRATRAAIDAIGTAREAGIAALRTVAGKKHEMKESQAEFGQVLRALGGADEEVLAEVRAAGADLNAINVITRPGDSTPLSRTMTSTLRFPQESGAAVVFDDMASRIALAD